MNRSFIFKAASVAAFAATVSAGTASAQGNGGFANVLNVVGQAQISSTGAGNGFPLFIDFLSGAAFPPSQIGNGQPGNVFSGSTTGVFTRLAPATNGVIQDLVVSANGATTTTNPAGATFLAIDSYTFTLGSAPAGSTFGPITLRDAGNGNAEADFSVFGMVTGPGFAANTTYQGIFTAQFVGQTAAQVLNQINTGGSPVVTFSANFGAPVPTASTVPEPSTYVLMGMGLLGTLAAARRRRTQA